MAAGMVGPLRSVRCQHRWDPGPTLPYDRVPTLLPDSDAESSRLRIETGVCRRCGIARMRFSDPDQEYAYSVWDYAASMGELLLGRELDGRERRGMLVGIVLN